MEENSKQRVIGIIVVGVVVVVLLPFLLRPRPPAMAPLPKPEQQSIADSLKARSDKVSAIVQQTTPRLKEALSSPGAGAANDGVTSPSSPPAAEAEQGQRVLPALPAELETQKQSFHQKKTKSRAALSAKRSHDQTRWVVQLGTFQHKAYADRLVSRLKKAGYHPYLHKEYSTDVAGLQGHRALLYQVWVPGGTQSLAHKRLKQLRQRMHLEGIIINKPHRLHG